MERPIYIIEDYSHEWDDVCVGSSSITFVTDNEEEARNEFRKHEEFCQETHGNEKWCYEYILWQYDEPKNGSVIGTCNNYYQL